MFYKKSSSWRILSGHNMIVDKEGRKLVTELPITIWLSSQGYEWFRDEQGLIPALEYFKYSTENTVCLYMTLIKSECVRSWSVWQTLTPTLWLELQKTQKWIPHGLHPQGTWTLADQSVLKWLPWEVKNQQTKPSKVGGQWPAMLRQSDQLKPKDGEGVSAERPLNLGLERWLDRSAIEGFVFVSIQFTVRHHRIPWLRILSLLRGNALTNSSVSFEPKQRKRELWMPTWLPALRISTAHQGSDRKVTGTWRGKKEWPKAAVG